ncbi:DinB family protein [Streptomyces sp. NPDC015131]|uniref:DinB family protein n=1 Tax=Streptomyces sp. NPDC015131 TaxID=3364941 RepID=UPI0036F85EA7
MPVMAVETGTDEREALLACWEKQREALRRAAGGLTDEQARSTPSASELSLAALLTHAVRGEPAWIPVLRGEGGDWTDRDGEAEFRPPAGQSVGDLLREHRRVGEQVARAVRELPGGLDREVPMPVTPWGPPEEPRSVRWILLHLIAEAARHAGHADLVRESLDGATALELREEARV